MLSASDIEHFRTFGFVVLRRLLDASEVIRLRDEIDQALTDAYGTAYGRNTRDDMPDEAITLDHPILSGQGTGGRAISSVTYRRFATERFATGRDLLRRAQEALAARFASARARGEPRLLDLLARWQRGELADGQAASALLQVLQGEGGAPP